MSDIESRIGKLSPEKRALLERGLMRRREAIPTAVIPRRGEDGPCVLSFSQQRLWFLDQWAPGDPAYNAVIALRAQGSLDVERLRRALVVVIERHEALRTVFRPVEGAPRQVVLGEWSFELPVFDLRPLAPADREREMLRIAREQARRRFDLAADLMLRVCAIRIGEHEHVLLALEHHIAFDGWSDSQLFAELGELYRAESEGREPELPELPIQYMDFAAWQRERMQGEVLAEHLAHWRSELLGAPPCLQLPTDRPRPPVQRFDGAHHHFELDPQLPAAVRALAAAEGATPFIVLLAAFAALLGRWSGERDILVGSPIAGRGRPELEHLIGFFSNTIVLRVRLDGDPSFRQLVRRARETAIAAYEHQDLPFEKLVEELRPPRDPSRNPIFQVNFRVQSAAPATLSLPGVEITSFDLDIGFSRFDLALELQLHPGRFSGYVEYNEALFEEGTARRLASRLRTLLADALARPDATVSSLAFEPSRAIRGARRRQ
jgi:condensation domain-containing protein